MGIFKLFLLILSIVITTYLCVIFIAMANDVRAIRKKLVSSSETSKQKQPNYKKRRVKKEIIKKFETGDKMTLSEYIQYLGETKAAEDFGASIHAIRAWRYEYRQPSIAQAKKIISATDGRLDYESIYGSD